MPFPTFPTQAEIPEAFRSEYEERDGAWHPKGAAASDVAALKTALEKERELKKAEETARAKAERERDDLKRNAAAKASGISEEELQKIRDAEAAARKPIEDRAAQLEAENRKLKLTDRVQALALKHGVMPDRIEDAMMALSGRTDLTDGDGIVVKGRDGKVTTTTVDEFLGKEFKAEKPWLYAGTVANGGGSNGSDGGAPSAGGYDPVKAGKEAAAAQKKGAKENERAFR